MLDIPNAITLLRNMKDKPVACFLKLHLKAAIVLSYFVHFSLYSKAKANIFVTARYTHFKEEL